MSTDSSIVVHYDNRNRYSNISYNLNYQTKIDTSGKELTVDFDHLRYNNKDDANYNNYFLDVNGQPLRDPLLSRSFSPSTIKIWSGKTDYSHPFNSETKLEAGLKFSLVETDNEFRFDNLNDSFWENELGRSNVFDFNENINAAYINLNHSFKSVNIQAGLRAEQTNSKGKSITENSIVNKHYIDFFPTLSVKYDISEKNQIGFSYGRRIDRPDYQSLNPFLSFIDIYTFAKGNPYLKPQYTNSYELSYILNKKLNFALGYSHTTDVISPVVITNPVEKTLIIIDQNLSELNFYSLNIGVPLNVTSWWQADNNLTTYINDYRSKSIMDAPYKNGKFTFIFNTNHTFNFGSSTRGELSANYQSAQVFGTYEAKPLYGIDLGISKAFLKDRLKLKFAANDVFNMRKLNINSGVPRQNYKVYQKEESRVFRISLSYFFGGNEIKSANQRSRSSAEEENRVKNGN